MSCGTGTKLELNSGCGSAVRYRVQGGETKRLQSRCRYWMDAGEERYGAMENGRPSGSDGGVTRPQEPESDRLSDLEKGRECDGHVRVFFLKPVTRRKL